MTLQKIARRDSGYTVVCIVPDFCFIPPVVPPVPFPLYANLVNASESITDAPHSSSIRRFGLESATSLNIGAESDINECVNYKMPNNIPSVNDVLHQWSNMY